MEHQYYSQRFRYRNGRRVGTVPVGEIVYIQDNVSPFRFTEYIQTREPWQVEGWIPREMIYRGSNIGQHSLKRCAGGHLAVVRSLRDQRKTKVVADWLLLACIDRGLVRF
jgi:hypothetical protein